jgi:hypothetical protein
MHIMAAKVSLALNGICEILIVDADGQHLALESFKNLDAARQLPGLVVCPLYSFTEYSPSFSPGAG